MFFFVDIFWLIIFQFGNVLWIVKESAANCIALIGDHLMIHECFFALFYERFIYEMMFYEAWP